jgi:hypothetical protein
MATTLRQQVTFLRTSVIILLLFVIATLYYVYFYKNTNSPEKDKDKVCMRLTDYNKLLQKPVIAETVAVRQNRPSQERDLRVLRDPLYPALNRSETDTHDNVIGAIERKQLYNRTQEFTDRYRMVAYVTNPDDKKDSGGNVWKLMGRTKGRNQGDFYLIPANNNYDMKIMLTNDIVVGERIRDIYTIPKTLTFKSPLLNDTPYQVTELPMTDMTDLYN